MKHLFKNVVMVTCLMALGAFGAWLWFRPQLPQASTYHDGQQERSARDMSGVRLARWDLPEAFDSALRSGELESDPFVDPSTGQVYLSVGTPGQDQDLYRATPGARGAWDLRPLEELNTGFDEAGPSVHQGYLYFSSDREGGEGGHDLYRARITPLGFEPPQNLGPAVNGPADEVDPVFRPRTSELYFATNRDPAVDKADFDLVFSVRDEEGFSDLAPLTELRTAYDERAPAFSPSGALLVFASDRPEGAGGFDLYRSLHMGRTFENVQNLGAPNGKGDDLAPTLIDDGFTVLFSSDRGPDGRGDLFVARTRELYPLPGEGFSLLDFTILMALALIALLAFLARRWEALDILYKCLLLSFIVHLLLLWLSKRVEIEVESAPPGEAPEVFEVQLINDLISEVAQLEDVERGEQVDAPEPSPTEVSTERQQQQLARTELSAPATEALSRPEMAAAASATRSTATEYQPQRRSSADPLALRPLEEQYDRREAQSARMEVARAEVAPVQRAAEAPPERSAAELPTPSDRPPVAEVAPLTRSERAEASAPSAVDRRHQPVARPSRPRVVSVEGPSDRAERVVEASPTLSASTADVVAMAPAAVTTAEPSRTRETPASPRLVQPDTARLRTEQPMSKAPRTAVADPMRRRVEPTELGPARGSPTSPAESVAMQAPSDRLETAAATSTGMEIGGPRALAAAASSPSTTETRRATNQLPTPAAGDSAPSESGELDLRPRSLADAPSRSRTEAAMPMLADRASPSVNPRAELSDRVGEARTAATGTASASLASASASATAEPAATQAAPSRTGASELARPATAAPRAGSELARAARQDDTRGRRRIGDPLSRSEIRRPEISSLLQAPRAPNAAARAGAAALASSSLAAAPTRMAPAPSPGMRSLSLSRPQPARLNPVAAIPRGDRRPLSLNIQRDTPMRTAPRATAAPPPRLTQLYDRRKGAGKELALREGGGSADTEKAVVSGLRYLASVQRSNGSFGDAGEGSDPEKYRDVRIGKTALAALAFLGAGHDPSSNTEFSENVDRALRHLIEKQDLRSGHFGNSDGYGHGISTYALAECYALTKDRKLVSPLLRAIKHIQDYQILDARDRRVIGGWPYYYPEGRGVDPYPRTSLSSWQAMALESAKVGGLPVSEQALAAAKLYFVNCYDEDYQYFRYNHDPGWLNRAGGYRTLPATTPASMFVLNLLGLTEHPILDRGAEYVMQRDPQGYRFRTNDDFARNGGGNLYFWYYGTLAMYMRGGADWRRWNASMKDTLLPAQRRDGSWEPISTYAREYAGDDAAERTYSTAMCVLILEVYYRYFTPQLERQQK